MAARLKINLAGGLVQPINHPRYINLLCARQAAGADQIQSADVQPLEERVWCGAEFGQTGNRTEGHGEALASQWRLFRSGT